MKIFFNINTFNRFLTYFNNIKIFLFWKKIKQNEITIFWKNYTMASKYDIKEINQTLNFIERNEILA